MGRGRPNSPHEQEISSPPHRLYRFLHTVHRGPYQSIRPEESAGLGEGQGTAAKVNAVQPGAQDQVHPIVDQQRGTRGGGLIGEGPGQIGQVPPGRVGSAEMEGDVRTGLEDLPSVDQKVLPSEHPTVGDDVKLGNHSNRWPALAPRPSTQSPAFMRLFPAG